MEDLLKEDSERGITMYPLKIAKTISKEMGKSPHMGPFYTAEYQLTQVIK